MRNAREANIPSLYKFPHVFHSFCRDFFQSAEQNLNPWRIHQNRSIVHKINHNFANFIPAFPSLTSRDASAPALAVGIGYIVPLPFFMPTLVLRALSLIQPHVMLIRIIWTKTALSKKYVSSFWDSFQPVGPYSSPKTIMGNSVLTDLLNFTCSRN